MENVYSVKELTFIIILSAIISSKINVGRYYISVLVLKISLDKKMIQKVDFIFKATCITMQSNNCRNPLGLFRPLHLAQKKFPYDKT